MQEFNQTISNLQENVSQLQSSDSARNIWSGPAAALTFGGLLLNIYLFCRQKPQLEAKKQQDERDMDLVLETLGIEKSKPIEPIYPYERPLAYCFTKCKNIVNNKQANNSIKPNKQDIKEIIKLKILEMQQEESIGVTRPEQVQNYATRLLNTMGNGCKKNKKTKEQRQAKLTEYFSKDNNIESSLQNQDIEQGESRLQISPEGSLQSQDTIHQRNVKKNTSLEVSREL